MAMLSDIRTGNVVELIYHSKTNDFSKRRIKVLKVTEQTITGYCYLRKEVRTFSANHILALQTISRGEWKRCTQPRKKIG